MSQSPGSPFQEALDTLEALPPHDQKTVIGLVQQRLAEQRRGEIARNAEETLQGVREGRAECGSVRDLKRDLEIES